MHFVSQLFAEPTLIALLIYRFLRRDGVPNSYVEATLDKYLGKLEQYHLVPLMLRTRSDTDTGPLASLRLHRISTQEYEELQLVVGFRGIDYGWGTKSFVMFLIDDTPLRAPLSYCDTNSIGLLGRAVPYDLANLEVWAWYTVTQEIVEAVCEAKEIGVRIYSTNAYVEHYDPVDMAAHIQKHFQQFFNAVIDSDRYSDKSSANSTPPEQVRQTDRKQLAPDNPDTSEFYIPSASESAMRRRRKRR